METVTCNLCGSADQRIVYTKPDEHYRGEEWFTVVECLNCGLGFLNPRPTTEEMDRYYPSQYYEYFSAKPDFHQRRYEIESEVVSAKIPDGIGRSLLDVGCANGNFPRRMQMLGWKVEGVEVSNNSERITDFKVYHEQLPHIPIDTPRYDAITAWSVLEHVHDPMAYFQKASKILKPNGIFVFVVPNFESLSSRSLFREDTPRHLYFFTRSTIREFLARADLMLTEIGCDNSIFEMRPLGWLRYYTTRLFGGKLRWQDLPPTRLEYLARHRLKNDFFSNFRYLITHPFTVFDRLLMPLYERWQLQSGSYGMLICVATKQ
jgi:SAM-dependent methyltransferase